MEEQLRLAIEKSFPIDTLTIACLEVIEKPTMNWVEQYLSAIYLWKLSNENNQHDSKIMETLENLINRGLTIGKDKEAFIQSSLILSQLHFKYGRYRHASNYLLLLREYENENTPGWVYNYSAKLHFKIDIASVTTPSTITKYLEASAQKYDNNLDSQAVAVFREYIIASIEYFKTALINPQSLSSYVQYLTPWVERFNLDSSEEWSKLLSFYSELNKVATTGISSRALEAENRMLLGLLEERTRTINQQRDEILNLLMKNQEFEEKINELNSDTEKKQKEIIDQIREEIGIDSNDLNAFDRVKILILGTPQISEKQIWGIASTLGVEKDQLEMHLDYSENKRYDLDKLRYNSPFSGILVGPVAHKVVGLGDHTSVIQKLQEEDGYPPVIEIRTHSGELKITKSSFREALSQILNIINANMPVN